MTTDDSRSFFRRLFTRRLDEAAAGAEPTPASGPPAGPAGPAGGPDAGAAAGALRPSTPPTPAGPTPDAEATPGGSTPADSMPEAEAVSAAPMPGDDSESTALTPSAEVEADPRKTPGASTPGAETAPRDETAGGGSPLGTAAAGTSLAGRVAAEATSAGTAAIEAAGAEAAVGGAAAEAAVGGAMIPGPRIGADDVPGAFEPAAAVAATVDAAGARIVGAGSSESVVSLEASTEAVGPSTDAEPAGSKADTRLDRRSVRAVGLTSGETAADSSENGPGEDRPQPDLGKSAQAADPATGNGDAAPGTAAEGRTESGDPAAAAGTLERDGVDLPSTRAAAEPEATSEAVSSHGLPLARPKSEMSVVEAEGSEPPGEEAAADREDWDASGHVPSFLDSDDFDEPDGDGSPGDEAPVEQPTAPAVVAAPEVPAPARATAAPRPPEIGEWRGIVLVTGTDTDVGKTIATAAVAAAAAASGLRVAVIKPGQTGIATGAPTDIEVVTRLAGPDTVRVLAEYPDPLAPLAAATVAEMAPLELYEVVDAVRAEADKHDLVLVEGAGGLLVPMGVRPSGDAWTLADLATTLGVGALVVARAGLGTLNHTALTLEALARRGVPAGVIIGAWPSDPQLVHWANLSELVPHLVGALPDGAGRMDPGVFRRSAPGWLTPALYGVLDNWRVWAEESG
jgi:dethiobiotin synthetase